MPKSKKQSNAEYYARHSRRIIIRESELCPSAIAELVECLEDQGPKKNDMRIKRLRALYLLIMGVELQ